MANKIEGSVTSPVMPAIKETIMSLRTDIAALRDDIQAHIGATGLAVHGAVTDSTNGFMTPALLAEYNTLSGLVDTLESVVKGNELPVGSIIWWGLSAGEIPSNYRVCDGTNGTPDLRNRFIMCCSSTGEANQTGGSNTVTFDTTLPAHNHLFWNITQIQHDSANQTAWARDYSIARGYNMVSTARNSLGVCHGDAYEATDENCMTNCQVLAYNDYTDYAGDAPATVTVSTDYRARSMELILIMKVALEA